MQLLHLYAFLAAYLWNCPPILVAVTQPQTSVPACVMHLLQPYLAHPILWKVLEDNRACSSSFPTGFSLKQWAAVTLSQLLHCSTFLFQKQLKLFPKECTEATTEAKGDIGWEMETMCWFYIPIFKIDYATLQHQETNKGLGISVKVTAVVAH